MLKTCLYDKGVLDLRTLLREGASDEELASALVQAVGCRYVDGKKAQQENQCEVEESMARVGG